MFDWQMNVNMYICRLNIPRSSDNCIFQQFSDVVKTFVDIVQCTFDDIILICGDFNCPSLDWVNENDKL